MIIESADGCAVEVENQMTSLALSLRLKRSLRSFALGLLLALASIPLPGLHFVLVPSFLIFAVSSGIQRLRETSAVDLTKANCPVCQKQLKEKVRYFKNSPLRLYCYECRTQLSIR